MEALYFKTEGSGITQIARDFWKSDTPRHAVELCKSCGMNLGQSLDLLLGKTKFVGVNEFELVEDDFEHEYNFTVKGMTERLQDKASDIFVMIQYLTNKPSYEIEQGEDIDLLIKCKQKEIDKILPELEFLYSIDSTHDRTLNQFLVSLATLPTLRDLRDPNNFGFGEYTEEAIDLYCNRNSLARPFSKGTENLLIKEHGPSIKEIEVELIKKNRREELIGDLHLQIDAHIKDVKEFHEEIKDVIVMSTEQLEAHTDLSEAQRTIYEIMRNHAIKRKDMIILIPLFMDPETTFPDNGYILPNGRMYITGYQGHNFLDENLLRSGQVHIPNWCIEAFGSIKWDEAGWIKISSGSIMRGYAREVAHIEKWDKIFPDAQKEALTKLLLSAEDKEYTWWRDHHYRRGDDYDPLFLINEIEKDYED